MSIYSFYIKEKTSAFNSLFSNHELDNRMEFIKMNIFNFYSLKKGRNVSLLSYLTCL